MKKLRVKRSRDYYPHHMLLGAADANLDLAEKQEPGWFYYEMVAILFSALAVEALANSFGQRCVEKWNDYETARPLAKLRIVSMQLGVEFNEAKKPWCHIRWLFKFRNDLAHARPEKVLVDREMTEDEWQKERTNTPNSKIEREISLKNAKRAVNSSYAIRDLFCDKISPNELHSLRADGWSSVASALIAGQVDQARGDGS